MTRHRHSIGPHVLRKVRAEHLRWQHGCAAVVPQARKGLHLQPAMTGPHLVEELAGVAEHDQGHELHLQLDLDVDRPRRLRRRLQCLRWLERLALLLKILQKLQLLVQMLFRI